MDRNTELTISAETPSAPRSNASSPVSQVLEGGISGRNSPTVSESRLSPNAVPAACLACRGKHLKCDGKYPCTRCIASESDCIYVASRRGYKGPRRRLSRNPSKWHASSSPPDSTASPSIASAMGSATLASPLQTQGSHNPMSEVVSFPVPLASNSAPFLHPYPTSTGYNLVPSQRPPATIAERCLDAFYQFFHQAHPFVLPHEPLLQIAREGSIEPLLAAMRWIGSLYLDIAPARTSLLEEAQRLASDPECPRDGFLVQALMLLLLGLDGSDQQEKAREILVDVERIAVQICLNTRSFATLNGRGLPVLEESWRRTWWDLFVIDGMVASTHRTTNFLLFDITADVALPCEEHQYLAGNIPHPAYLEDFDNCDFAADDRDFSSFAYRILSARNLGKLIRASPTYGPEDENISRIELLLTNWRLHLPDSKRDSLDKDGQLDEMMFQAHMMMHATSILLHQPHSQLDSSPARMIESCSPANPTVLSQDGFNMHTRQVIQAANGISRLIMHRVPLLSHTHFFACMVSLSSTVHLGKWALYFMPHDDDDLRQRIRLSIGSVREMARVWECADKVASQVTSVAQEIYRVKKQQQMTPQFWLDLGQEEVTDSIAADDSIINEIERMQEFGGYTG